MVKRVLVLRGEWDGRFMSMTDADADAAVAGNWALDHAINPATPDDELVQIYSEPVDEGQVDEWYDKIDEPTYSPTAEEEGDWTPPSSDEHNVVARKARRIHRQHRGRPAKHK